MKRANTVSVRPFCILARLIFWAMIKTAIIVKHEDNTPVWYPYDGLAVSITVAKWLFELCGWRTSTSDLPELTYQTEEIEWIEGDDYFPTNNTRVSVLGALMFLN